MLFWLLWFWLFWQSFLFYILTLPKSREESWDSCPDSDAFDSESISDSESESNNDSDFDSDSYSILTILICFLTQMHEVFMNFMDDLFCFIELRSLNDLTVYRLSVFLLFCPQGPAGPKGDKVK